MADLDLSQSKIKQSRLKIFLDDDDDDVFQ